MSAALPGGPRVLRAACLLMVVVVLASASAYAQRRGGGAPQASLVQVMPVEQRSLAAGYTFSGTVHPARRAILGSAVDGRLEAIVDDGMWVERRQPVARLRTRTIDIEIAGAKAEEQLRTHEQEEMEAGLRKEEIEVALAKADSAKALAEYAKNRYDRTKSLFERGQATSQEEVEQAFSAYVAAHRSEAAAVAEHKLAVEGYRQEKKLQAADRLRMAQEAVRQLQDRREKYHIRPYFSGYVVTKHAEVGAWIKQGDPLLEVIELDPVEINVSMPEAHIAKVKPGMEVQVRVDSVSLRDVWTGTVARIVPEADFRSRTFQVKVRVKNPEDASAIAGPTGSAESPAAQPKQVAAASDRSAATDDEGEVPAEEVRLPAQTKQHKFKSGMLANCSFRLGEKTDALVVHKDALVLGGAVIDGQPSYTVFVAKPSPDGAAHVATAVPVAIGVYDGDWVEVASRTPGALAKGDLVVTVGNERLQPGQGIRFTAK